jgi:methylthioribulose-1-phosphate dehydratase
MIMIERIAARGWAPATAGNYSIRLGSDPIRLLISPSGTDKTLLRDEDLLEVSDRAEVLNASGKTSAETLLHVVTYQERPAMSVMHVHTVWNTILSEHCLRDGAVEISGYEILKALDGVTTHKHTERIPIFENSQDMVSLSQKVKAELRRDPAVKAFLLAGHGLYTWGKTPADAYRHIEALEFLFEVVVRKSQLQTNGGNRTWPAYVSPS